MADLRILKPLSNTVVSMMSERTFIAFGTVTADLAGAGIGAHLVRPGTRDIVAVGRLLGFVQATPAHPYFWTIKFSMRHVVETFDDKYDIIFTTYRARDGVTSEAVFDEVAVIRNIEVPAFTVAAAAAAAGAAAAAAAKTPTGAAATGSVDTFFLGVNQNNNDTIYNPYFVCGDYTNSDKPYAADMKAAHASPVAGLVMPMGSDLEGGYFISFGTLAPGTYTLTIKYGATGEKKVTGLVLN